MSDPDNMKNWVNVMMKNPPFMNKLMTNMMSNPDFRQQYMGPWLMTQYGGPMHEMMTSLPPAQNATFYQHMIIKSDKVSIVSGAWQINTTESYHPTIIQVITGTTVTWTNDDSIIHTVTDTGGKFDSDLIQPGSGWKYTFYNEGKYTYFCTIHPWMKGLVIVT
jgi:plastocyanin